MYADHVRFHLCHPYIERLINPYIIQLPYAIFFLCLASNYSGTQGKKDIATYHVVSGQEDAYKKLIITTSIPSAFVSCSSMKIPTAKTMTHSVHS